MKGSSPLKKQSCDGNVLDRQDFGPVHRRGEGRQPVCLGQRRQPVNRGQIAGACAPAASAWATP